MNIRLMGGLLALLLASPVGAQNVDEPVTDLEVRVAEYDADQLKAEADAFKAAIEKSQGEVERLEQEEGEATDEEAKKKLQEQIAAEEKTVERLAERLQVIVNALKEKGVEVAEYQILLTKTTGITLENVSVGAAVGLMDEWVTQGKDWLAEEGPNLLVNLVLFLLILFAFKILASIAGKIVERALKFSKLKVSDLLQNFFVNIVTKAVFFVGLVMALQVIGVPVGPLLAGVGVLGFVVGFALQDTLANFASGIMILLYRPYDIGNYVTAGGVSGTVKAMSLVSTTLFTPDNKVEVVPNGKIWGDVITNVSANPTRRVDLTIGIGYDDDIDKAEKVLTDVVTSHPMVLKDPAPVIRLHNLGDSSVDFVVRPWCKSSDYWAVYWELTKGMKQRLDKEGITIPYPQRDLHIMTGNLEAAGAGKA